MFSGVGCAERQPSVGDGPVYVAGLDGRLEPVVESFGLDADPNKLVYSWRVYADYGAALGEHRSGVKSDGV